MKRDPVLRSLTALESVLAANIARAEQMLRRIEHIRAERDNGRPWSELVPDEPRPLVVEMLSASAIALDSAGAHLRRTEARALHDEGLTMDQIAELFGVSRQRVSALLKGGRD